MGVLALAGPLGVSNACGVRSCTRAGQPGAELRVPHTEANFLLKEMGFALARKHARRLRALSLLLLAGVPALVLLPAHTWPALRVPAAAILLPAVTCGVFIERWLFFAEARHVVMTYYQPQGRSG